MRKAILLGAACAFVLSGCATGTGGGTDLQPTIYGIGQQYANILPFVDGIPLPSKVCGPIKAFSTLYITSEKIVVNGTGDNAAILQDLETGLAGVISAAADVGFSMAAHPALKASAPQTSDPTSDQWAAQIASINAGTAALNCV